MMASFAPVKMKYDSTLKLMLCLFFFEYEAPSTVLRLVQSQAGLSLSLFSSCSFKKSFVVHSWPELSDSIKPLG